MIGNIGNRTGVEAKRGTKKTHPYHRRRQTTGIQRENRAENTENKHPEEELELNRHRLNTRSQENKNTKSKTIFTNFTFFSS